MKFSKHAHERSQQRGIPEELALVILLLGKERELSGGAKEFSLQKRDIPNVVSTLKRVMDVLHKAVGKSIVVDNDEETLITMYHSNR